MQLFDFQLYHEHRLNFERKRMRSRIALVVVSGTEMRRMLRSSESCRRELLCQSGGGRKAAGACNAMLPRRGSVLRVVSMFGSGADQSEIERAAPRRIQQSIYAGI